MNKPIHIAHKLIQKIYTRWPNILIYPECSQNWGPDYAIFTYDSIYNTITVKEILKLANDPTVKVKIYSHAQEVEIYRDKNEAAC